MLNIIPDIHADVDRLNRSLKVPAPFDQVAFLGDLIDGNPAGKSDDLAVLMQASLLIDSGRAIGVMGNHELNAILFHTLGNDGNPLRAHSNKNCNQHRTFLDQFGACTPEALEWTEWFLTLPLWIDFKGVRLVHACWSDPAISTIAARRPDGKLRREDLQEVAQKSSPFGQAVEKILSGPEAVLPPGYDFADSRHHRRNHVRLAWWRSNALTWRKAALSVPFVDELPAGDLPSELKQDMYAMDAPPVLVGHYKMAGLPAIDSPRASSIDYPATPCVYLWQGESALTDRNLIKL